jgi:hypothetical protein
VGRVAETSFQNGGPRVQLPTRRSKNSAAGLNVNFGQREEGGPGERAGSFLTWRGKNFSCQQCETSSHSDFLLMASFAGLVLVGSGSARMGTGFGSWATKADMTFLISIQSLKLPIGLH